MTNPSHSFIILVGDESVLLLPPQHLPDADPLFAQSHDMEDAAALLEVISMAPHLPVLILSDCSDQLYTYENLPVLSAIDRKKLLSRRLHEIYPDAAYTTALEQENNKALMVGVKETKALALWQERIDKLPNPCGIISLLPLESADMLAALWPEAREGWAIMLSFHKTGGTRQIVTHDGKIVFTRLTAPISENTSVGYMSATIAIDIKATRDYLLRMGFSNETPFHLIALMPQNMHSAMQATPLDVSTRHFFTPHEAAVKLNLPLAPEKDETISDLIHALWLSRRSDPKVPLAKDAKLRELRQIKIHKIGMITAIVFSMIAGVLIGQTTLDFLKSQRIVYEVQYDIDQLKSTQTKQQTKLTLATAPLSRLRMAVERKRLFKKEMPQPLMILSAIKDVIGEDARVYNLSWENGKLNFTLRLTDEVLTKKPLSLNKAEIKNRFKIIEQDMRSALAEANPSAMLEMTKAFFATASNKTLTNEDETETPKLPLSSYSIEWRTN